MRATENSRPLLAFCHVPKAGGTTIVHLLRRHFGVRHIDAGRRAARVEGGRVVSYHYSADDLRKDLRLYPFARSISSHYLYPCTDFEENESRLRWFTILREPISRIRSQYLYEVEIRGRAIEIPEWFRRFRRKNLQVRKFAGEADLDLAKEVLANKVRCVGLIDRFDESLLLMRKLIPLGDISLRYGEAANSSDKRGAKRDVNVFRYMTQKKDGRPPPAEFEKMREEALEQLERHAALLEEANDLDSELYRFATEVVWPAQVEAYGGESLLAEDVAREVKGDPEDGIRERWNLGSAFAYRNVVYKPILDRALRRNDER